MAKPFNKNKNGNYLAPVVGESSKGFAKGLVVTKNDRLTRRQDDTVIFHRVTLSTCYPFLIVWVLLLGFAAACQQQPAPSVTSYPLPPTLFSETPTATFAAAYPEQSTPSAYPYPAVSPTPRPNESATSSPIAAATLSLEQYLPFIAGGDLPTATSTSPPTNTPLPTPTPTIDFAAVRQQLQAQGQDLGLAKLGFHTGAGGNMNGIGVWMQRLDEAGVPFFLKSADNAGPLLEAQNLMRASGVPHTLVFRRSGNAYDTPDYALSPQVAAAQHWALHKAAWPPELDPSLVWIETINEVDKTRSVWLAQFAQATAELALADGYKWAAFGWSSGEPELTDWQSPAMLGFLRFAAAHPDRIAIALHEYSYITSDIGHEYPYKVGRFQFLFQVCDQNSIPRPTVLITEWGWEYENVPGVDEALTDIAWAARMYAAYPQIKGAAIWYLGGNFNNIHDQTQQLIGPVTEYSLGNYFAIPLPPAAASLDPAQFQP